MRRFVKPSIIRLKNGLSNWKYDKNQTLFLFDAIINNAALILTMGFFLSGYIVLLHGSDYITGLLNSSITMSSIIALLSILIFERLKKRKTVLITLNTISRVMVCSIIFLPLISKNQPFVLYMAVGMALVGNLLYGFYSIGMTVWMIDLLPKESRNGYIYTRMFWLRISFTLITVVMGFVLDFFNKSYAGFFVVFVTSLVLSIIDIIILTKIDEPPRKQEILPALTVSKFFEPLRNRQYLSFLVFIFLFYISLTMSSSYTPLYLIKYLNFDYGFISATTVLSYIMMIVCTKFWAKIQMRKGQMFVLKITAIFVLGEYLLNSFLRSETPVFLVIGLIFSGIGYSGFNISIFAYRYEIIPEDNRTIYEGWYCAFLGISFLIAPLLGSFIMNRLPVFQNAVYQHSNFQLLYLISFAACALTILFTFYVPSKLCLTDKHEDK